MNLYNPSKKKKKIHNKDPKVSEVFSLCDDALLYNGRIVIPNSLQRKFLRDFYMGHPGKNRTKSLMRCYVYWPNMDRDIGDIIESCKACALAAKSPTTTCKPWPNTDHPWQRIHTDFAEPVDNMYYLIVVDSHSKGLRYYNVKDQPPTARSDFYTSYSRVLVWSIVWWLTTALNSHQVNSKTFTRRIKWATLQRLSINPGQMVRPRVLWTP